MQKFNLFSNKSTLLYTSRKYCSSNKINTSFIGIGSNLGNRFNNLQKCYKMIGEFAKIEKTSQIYQSPCVNELNEIEKDENNFLNAVVKVKSGLSPSELLLKCKNIEKQFQRQKKIKNHEAREIDVDILTYNNEILDLDKEHFPEKLHSNNIVSLHIPHLRVPQRLFVLKPLLDIDENCTIIDRKSQTLILVKELLRELIKKEYEKSNNQFNFDKIHQYDSITNLNKTFNVNLNGKDKTIDLNDKSLVMGIVNCTPDSFSDGWLKNNLQSDYEYDKIIDNLVENKDYIDIIDIGGESTKLGSKMIDPNIELERISILIQKIRKHPLLFEKLISIDTRKSYVALNSLKLGANIINDVSGGNFDPQILKVISEYNVPYVCMHSRGPPETMMDKINITYNKDLMMDISHEIEERLIKCRENNIPDWNIIIDPGIGFSKTTEQNVEIIKNIDQLKKKFPNNLLLGHSRKKFLREIMKVKNPEDTLSGNIAVTTAAIERGVNIVRVHDYKQISQSIKISDKLCKN